MTRTAHNFVRGMGSVVNLLPAQGPCRVGQGIDLNRTDAEALEQDWQHVAQDFRAAFDEIMLDTATSGGIMPTTTGSTHAPE